MSNTHFTLAILGFAVMWLGFILVAAGERAALGVIVAGGAVALGAAGMEVYS